MTWRQGWPPYVTVLVDRQGADLVAYRREGPELRREAGGDDYPLRKPNAGGWSQRRYQERAENTWERNADDAAEQVVRLARRVDARLVVAAGDERAVTLLRDALPEDWVDRLQVVSAGRSQDGSEQSFGEQARIAVELAVNADTDALMEKFREERGQDDRACEGPAPALAALAMAAVDVLLLSGDDPDDGRTAWFGPDPTQVTGTASDSLAWESTSRSRAAWSMLPCAPPWDRRRHPGRRAGSRPGRRHGRHPALEHVMGEAGRMGCWGGRRPGQPLAKRSSREHLPHLPTEGESHGRQHG